MKKSLFLSFCLFFVLNAFAQECTSFFPLKKGAEMEYTSYDKKDKQTSRMLYEVIKVSENSAEAKTKLYDEKDVRITSSEFEVKCENGVFKIDMRTMIPAQQLESMNSAEMEIENAYLDFPSNLSVGKSLPDGEVKIKIKSNGATLMTMTIKIINRKVIAQEEVTTPAGTFMCYKISEETFVDLGMMKTTTRTESWITEGVGSIKTISYNKKGKIEGTTLLTLLSGN